MPKSRRSLRPHLEPLDDRCLLSGYTPAQLTHAYGLDAIAFRTSAGAIVPGDGSGETIALIEADHDPSLASDLHVFDQANGLPDPQLAIEDQAGARTNATWASEETLDVEWAHAIAPGAGILVVEARSPGLTDLLSAVDTARNTPGVVAISMSWGFNEISFESSFDVHLTTPAGHEGITFIASSGDNGAKAGAEYPASSADVLAVGGTTLKLDGRETTSRRPPGTGAGEVIAGSRPSRVIRSRSNRRASGGRPTSFSTAIRRPASRSTRPRSAAARGRGRKWAAPASVPRPGRPSWPSLTRAERWPERAAWTVPPKPCRRSTASRRATSIPWVQRHASRHRPREAVSIPSASCPGVGHSSGTTPRRPETPDPDPPRVRTRRWASGRPMGRR